jgi:hypothetical protein
MGCTQFWFPPDSFGSYSYGLHAQMGNILSNIRIAAEIQLDHKFGGGFGIRVNAIALLAIDLDAANNGIGGADHAVLFDLLACPTLTGPNLPGTSTPSFELGGLELAASVFYQVRHPLPNDRRCLPFYTPHCLKDGEFCFPQYIRSNDFTVQIGLSAGVSTRRFLDSIKVAGQGLSGIVKDIITGIFNIEFRADVMVRQLSAAVTNGVRCCLRQLVA